MKAVKIVILFCLACSTAFSLFALWSETGWLENQKSALAVSSTPAEVQSVQQHYNSLDENTRTRFFGDFLTHLGVRDRSISASVNSSFQMTKTMIYVVISFNGLAAFCVIYLLVGRKKQPNTALEPTPTAP